MTSGAASTSPVWPAGIAGGAGAKVGEWTSTPAMASSYRGDPSCAAPGNYVVKGASS